MLWCIKLTRLNYVWSGANIRVVERRHGIWFWKNVCHSWLNSFYGMSIFNLHPCILSILIFIIPKNVDTLIALYFYVCRWKLKKREKIQEINKPFSHITQVMQVDWALKKVLVKSDDPYIFYVNAICCTFWNNFLWKSYILYNVLDIVSQLKDNGLLISVTITCTLEFLLLWTLCCPILYDNEPLIDI